MAEILIESNANIVAQQFKNNASQLAGALQDAAKEQEKETLKLFKGTTRGWNNQPKFLSDTEITASGFVILAGTDDKVYGFLDRGTSVRHALMSSDWQSKTKPGSLQSGAGRGHVVFISRKIIRPGIKARDFTKGIAKVAESNLPALLNKHIKKWVRRF